MPLEKVPADIPFWYPGKTEVKMELMIPLSSQDPRPLYEQIYQYIKGEIRNGGPKPMKSCPLPGNWPKARGSAAVPPSRLMNSLWPKDTWRRRRDADILWPDWMGSCPRSLRKDGRYRKCFQAGGMGRRRISRRKNGEWTFHPGELIWIASPFPPGGGSAGQS